MPTPIKREAAGIRRTVTAVASIVAAIVLVVIPAGYFVTQWRAEVGHTQSEAKRLADAVARFAYVAGPLWNFQGHRIDQVIVEHRRDGEGGHDFVYRVLDAGGDRVAESGDPLPAFSLRAEAPINHGHTVIGRVVAGEDLGHILTGTLAALLVSACLSVALFVAMGRIPLRAIDSAFGRLAEAENALRDQVAELEDSNRKITEAVTAQERMETVLARAVDLTPAIFALFDAQDRLVYCNQLYRDLYETEAAPMAPGVTFEALVRAFAAHRGIGKTPEDAEEWIARRLNRRANPAQAYQYQRADGQWMEMNDYILADGGILTAGLVITDRKRVEDGLRELQKMEAVGELTAGIAHDFNNLLAVIVGTLDLMASSDSVPAKQRPFVERAIAAAQRGAALTDQLLAFARRQVLNPKIVDANVIVEDLAPGLGRTFGDSVKVVVDKADGLWECRVDPKHLENALTNLGLNARDAMPDGGTIAISTRNVAVEGSRADRGSDRLPGEYVVVAISDTGTGMSPEVRARAFEPFFTTKEFGRGSGLGLSMVYGFVKQSRGFVELESAPGRGTTVRLYLPRVRPEARPPVHAKPAAPDSVGKKVVLVVEDNAGVRETSCMALKHFGYETVEAENASAALAVLGERSDIAVLFTDIVMPGGMDGFELAREAAIRAPHLKVLFVSGYASAMLPPDDTIFAKSDILPKPYSLEKLGACMAKLIGADE